MTGTGLVACSSSSDGETVTQTTVRATTTSGGGPEAEAADTTGPGEALRWEVASFGFVSAYVLARGSEVALVDTGVSGSVDRFDDAFAALGTVWSDVEHVVLTHLHADHVGGLGEVLANAPDAAADAGEADVAGIDSPRPLTPVVDGDDVFGVRIIGTPGHTAGHVSVFDEATGLLVAGDALTTQVRCSPNWRDRSERPAALRAQRPRRPGLAVVGALARVARTGPPTLRSWQTARSGRSRSTSATRFSTT